MDQKRAEKYGISVERYYRILEWPNMTKRHIEILYTKGWDFTDTSRDLQLFAGIQTIELPIIAEHENEYEESV